MWHGLLGDSSFYWFLLLVDGELAQEVAARRCRHCEGPLRVSNYPRKPRGEDLPEALAAHYAVRLSYSCGREGCRRRTTPPSVRFLGRRVYLAAIVTLVTAMRHGATGARAAALAAHVSAKVSRQTMRRWLVWWRRAFPTTPCWGELRGFFSPAPVSLELPMSLLCRVGQGLPEVTRLALTLWHLRALTTASAPPCASVPMALRDAQKM